MNRCFALLRSGVRFGSFLATCGAAGAHAAWLGMTRRTLPKATRQARWLRRWCAVLLRQIGVTVTVQGRAPDGGMLVCNHVSYLDMPALTAATEMVFISKAEVRSWPLIGTIATLGGTLFLDRSRRAPVVEVGQAAVPIVAEGVVVTLFPEGTSTAGDHVLPFHSSLLAPAAEHGWPVTPTWVGYELADGSVVDEVAYWRDMTFLPHFLNLLRKRHIRAIVRFGEPLRNTDRKALARELHAAVRRLASPDSVPATAAAVVCSGVRGDSLARS